ncbi:hypothetical protein N7468_004512 [Penicillium chermesinum]|uniref:Uncharacterized protein n=1 Tax=Penicillium chermesinum TaxID=63820 RepID=A0A9W9PB02_9EURO|nr:uncharacterized protein N7468_004512 [Penicillium chermesinum]KAJ5239893.1 hypothetical protein N7468_004512 [Penicillium chermesinum]
MEPMIGPQLGLIWSYYAQKSFNDFPWPKNALTESLRIAISHNGKIGRRSESGLQASAGPNHSHRRLFRAPWLVGLKDLRNWVIGGPFWYGGAIEP